MRAKLGINVALVKIRAAKAPGADLPSQGGVRDGDPTGYDPKRIKAKLFRENMEAAADKFEAASDQPVIPSRPYTPHNKITDLSAYRTKRHDAEPPEGY